MIALSYRATISPHAPVQFSCPLEPDNCPPLAARVGDVGPELCQLVTNYTPKRFPPGGAIVERKHDGIRALWRNRQLITRNGLPIWSTAHLWRGLERLEAALGGAHLIDGEYEEPGGFGATCKRFNETRCDGTPNFRGHGRLFLWDAVPIGVWQGQATGEQLERRKVALAAALARVDAPGVALVPGVTVWRAAEIAPLAAAAWARGEEGIVVKNPRSLHYAGRGPAWQRVKRKLTLDLRVIGYGARKDDPGVLGHIIVDHHGVGVRVAVGWSERERAELWHHPERIAGRVAEIEAMEATDWLNLRHPRFLRWRTDLEGIDL